jgi:hypothetical protein
VWRIGVEGCLRLRDSYVDLLFLYGHDNVPVLVVAEYPGATALEAVEGLRGGVAVGVVRAALDDGYPGRKAAEE